MKTKIVLTILFPLILHSFIEYPPFQLKVDSGISYHLSYIKEKKSIDIKNVLKQDFNIFPKSKSFGYKNGFYWIQLVLDKTNIETNYIAHIPTHNIDKVEVYELINDNLVLQSYTGNSLEKDKIEFQYQFPSFSVKSNPNEKSVYYLKVDFVKEANFPLKILNQKDFISYILNKKTINSLYYGTCVVIVLLNLFFFLKFRDKVYLFYALFLFSLMINFLLYDGSLINLFRGNPFYYKLEFIIHLSNEIWFLLFSIYFLNLNKTNPLSTKLFFLFPFTVFIFYITYFITSNFLYVAIADAIGISLFPILWFYGIHYIKKMPYVKFYVLGYLLIVPLAVFFIVGYPFGFWNVDGDMLIVKIASWLDILVFTYAISYKMKLEFQKTNQDIIELKDMVSKINLSPVNGFSNSNPYLNLLTNNTTTIQPLTSRELDILKHLNSGFNNREIGELLFISTNTVKYHVRNIYTKMDVKNREELKNKLKNNFELNIM